MRTFVTLSQLVIAFAVLNAWLFRAQRATSWRGGNARSLKEEFGVYGLPDWFLTTTGVLKVGLAGALLVGLWVPGPARPASIGLALFMAGAVAMHLKVADPLRKALPAFSLGLLALVVAFA